MLTIVTSEIYKSVTSAVPFRRQFLFTFALLCARMDGQQGRRSLWDRGDTSPPQYLDWGDM